MGTEFAYSPRPGQAVAELSNARAVSPLMALACVFVFRAARAWRSSAITCCAGGELSPRDGEDRLRASYSEDHMEIFE